MNEEWNCQLRRSLPKVLGISVAAVGILSLGISGWYAGWSGVGGATVGTVGTVLLSVLTWQEIQAFNRHIHMLVGIAALGFLGKILIVVVVNGLLVWSSVCYMCGLGTLIGGIILVLLVQAIVLCRNQPPTIMPKMSD